MPFLEKNLYTQASQIPNAGLGLFTNVFIPKGTTIIEYTGLITTWDKVKEDGDNLYIYYVNDDHVIDASKRKKSMGRYANDAQGMKKIKGLSNNADYVEENLRVYVIAKKDIQAGDEIFVSYGKEYWDVVKKNIELDK